MSDFISVSVLNAYIKNVIDAEDVLHNICVAGEISGFKCSGPHAYFTLKDENSQISGNLFSYAHADYIPRDGETVLAYGTVDYYGKQGKLNLKVRKFVPIGDGALALKLEELRKKLSAAGYFDDKHKKPIPRYCERICVLTAKTGAVIRDIITTCRRKNRIIDIDILPVKVQGAGAAESIIAALKTTDKLGYDAIIIARGGGSLEDLYGFNDERLVYAIFEADTPIISAVGHETDFTLCDFAADLRVPTPTAAGELVAYDVKSEYDRVRNYCTVYTAVLNTKLTEGRRNFDKLVRRITHTGEMFIEKNRSKIIVLGNRMSNALKTNLTESDNHYRRILAKIEANNPTKILNQGYYKIFSGGKELDVAKIRKDDEILVRGACVKITAKVSAIESTAAKKSGECVN